MMAFATQPTFTQPASQPVLRFLGSPEQLLVAGQQSGGEFTLFQTTGERGYTTSAEHAVGHHLAGQENRDVTARVRRAEQAGHERAGVPHLIGSARERRTLPNRRPSHPRTRPSTVVRPRAPRGSNQTQGNARSTQRGTSSRNAPVG